MGGGGFASLRGEARRRPAAPDPPEGVGVDTPAPAEGLSDSPEGRFLMGLSPAARDIALRKLSEVRQGRDPRKVSQDELDRYDDETKWNWLENVCRAESADKEASAAAAAQTQMEGHQ